jgi:fructose PTS system EIIBC or EIIC component
MVDNLPLYILSILVGTVVTAGMLFVLKRPLAHGSEEAETKEPVPALV